MLKALGLHAYNVVEACETAKVPRSTFYEWVKLDEQFAAAAFQVQEDTGAMIDSEIDRRGRVGVLEDVWHDGVVVGVVRKFSDTLLLARAKAHIKLREAYRDRSSIEHSGSLSGMDSKESEELIKKIQESVLSGANDPQV